MCIRDRLSPPQLRHLLHSWSNARPWLISIDIGKGQELQFLRNCYEEDEFKEFDIIPDRPAEQSLRQITNTELLPPPSDMPLPLDPPHDPDLPEFVSEQRIEFLVMARSRGNNLVSIYPKIKARTNILLTDNPDEPWGFPNEDMLQKIYDKICTEIDHIQIMDVVL